MNRLVKIAIATGLYYSSIQLTHLFIVDPFNSLTAYPAMGIALLCLFLFGWQSIWGLLLAKLVSVIQLTVSYNLGIEPMIIVSGVGYSVLETIQLWLSYRIILSTLEKPSHLLPRFSITILILKVGFIIPLAFGLIFGLLATMNQFIEFNQMIRYGVELGLGKSLPILAFIPVVSCLHQTNERKTCKIKFVGLLGMVLTLLMILLLASRHMSSLDYGRIHQSVDAKANLLVTELQSEVVDALENMDLLNSFEFDSQNIALGRIQFDKLVAPLYEGSESIRAFNLIRYISAEQRTAFERQLSETYKQPHVITRGVNAITRKCEDRDFYLSIAYVYPYERNEAAVGLELWGDQFSSPSIVGTINTGDPRMSPPIKLVQEQSKESGIVIYDANKPLNLTNKNGTDQLVVLGTVYSVDELLKKLFERIDEDNIAVAIFDTTGVENQFICGLNKTGTLDISKVNEWLNKYHSSELNLISKTVHFCEREWILHFIVDEHYYDDRLSMTSMLSAFAGFWIVLWFCSFFLNNSRSLLMVESLVHTRTSELQENKNELEIQRDRAEASLKAKGDFLAVMSHEIRTPMNGVQVAAELLADSELNEEQNQYVEIINNSSESLLSMINDIFDYSELDGNKVELNKSKVDLVESTNKVIQSFNQLAFSKKIRLIFEHNIPKGIWIITDRSRIIQILTIVIGNAVKFTDQGEVRCFIDFKKNQNTADLTLTVKDTGIGIPEMNKQSIFDVFTQVDASSTRRFEGTGLGLAICAKIIQLMNGSISFTSTENVGTTFLIRLKVPIEQHNLL